MSGAGPSGTSPIPGAGIALPKFDNTLGALLIGGLVAMGLWGITCAQTFTYFSQRTRDRLVFRLLVAALLALDTFDSALNCHILYFYLVSNYLNFTAITIPVWSVIVHVAITSLSNFLVRSMFARRFFRLSQGNKIFTFWIMAVSITDLVVGLVITVKAFSLTTFLKLDKLSTLLYLNFAAGTTSDVSVAVGLCFLLWRSRTGFKTTDSIVNTLMLYTVNTGLIVAVDAALGMITYAVMPHNFVFLGFYLLLSKLYLNSYLATLNARDDLRYKTDDPVSIHLSQLSDSLGAWNRFDTTGITTNGAIRTMHATPHQEKRNHSEPVAISVQTYLEKDDAGESAATSPV